MVTEGRWSCPRCSRTWVRDAQSESEWRLTIRTVQQKHGLRCMELIK